MNPEVSFGEYGARPVPAPAEKLDLLWNLVLGYCEIRPASDGSITGLFDGSTTVALSSTRVLPSLSYRHPFVTFLLPAVAAAFGAWAACRAAADPRGQVSLGEQSL